MEEKNKSNNVSIILLIILVICAGVIGFILGKGVFNAEEKLEENLQKTEEQEKTDDTTPEVNEIVYQKVEVENLNTKIAELDFNNKTTAEAFESEGIRDNDYGIGTITNGKVQIKTVKNNTTKTQYIDEITDAVSIGAGFSVQGSGSVSFYVLTSKGEVYKIYYDFYDASENTDYKGEVKKLDVNNAVSIAVVDRDFHLDPDAMTVTPTVYIKTIDGKILTDESFFSLGDNQSTLKEVVNK